MEVAVPVYSTSKAAVINLTRSAAIQLAEDKVRVNAICRVIFIRASLYQRVILYPRLR